MTNISEIRISYAHMKNVILEYYIRHGKNVGVSSIIKNSNDKDGPNTYTTFTITEKVILAGIQTEAKTVLTNDDLIEILNESLAEDGKEVFELIDNIHSYETSSGGYMDGNTEVRVGTKRIIGGQSFTVKVRPKEDTKTKTLKPDETK